jgi:hypothetical protein
VERRSPPGSSRWGPTTFYEEVERLSEFHLYFDSVGGDILNAVLPKIRARESRGVDCLC